MAACPLGNSGIDLIGDHLPMTTNAVQLELDPRELMGKKVGRLRRAGIVPVHLYGPGMEPRALQCQSSRLIRALARAGGATPISVTIQGESKTHLAFAREIQWDPRRGRRGARARCRPGIHFPGGRCYY